MQCGPSGPTKQTCQPGESVQGWLLRLMLDVRERIEYRERERSCTEFTNEEIDRKGLICNRNLDSSHVCND